MADRWNSDDDRAAESKSDERLRGRATDEDDDFDEVTEDQDDEEDIDEGDEPG